MMKPSVHFSHLFADFMVGLWHSEDEGTFYPCSSIYKLSEDKKRGCVMTLKDGSEIKLMHTKAEVQEALNQCRPLKGYPFE